MLDRDNGALNKLLGDLHLIGDEPPFWLIGKNAFWAIVMTTVWRLWPFAFLMMLAGMQSIPDELLRGGGGRRGHTVAALAPHHPAAAAPGDQGLMIILFLWTFNEFNTAYVLFGPAPPESADLLSLHIYVNSFVNLNFGLGSAMSVLLLVFLLLVTVLYMRVFRVGSERLCVAPVRGRLAHAAGAGDPDLRHALPALHDRRLVAEAAGRRAGGVPLDPVEPDLPALHRHLEHGPAGALLRQQPDRRRLRDGGLGDAGDLRRLRDLALPLPRAAGRSTSPCSRPRCSRGSCSCCRCS